MGGLGKVCDGWMEWEKVLDQSEVNIQDSRCLDSVNVLGRISMRNYEKLVKVMVKTRDV